MGGGEKHVCQIGQPLGIRIGIVIRIGHDFSSGEMQTGVTGETEPTIGGTDEPERKFLGNAFGRVCRTVIDHNDFIIGIIQFFQGFEAVTNSSGAIIGTDHNGNFWPHTFRREREFLKGLTDGSKSRFGLTSTIGQAEVPIFNFVTAAIPFIRPSKDKRSCASGRPNCTDLPCQYLSLRVLPLSQTIQPNFREDQGTFVGNVLKTGKVRMKSGPGFQIDVETHKIQEGELEIFGCRIIDVRDKSVRIDGLHNCKESFQKSLYLYSPIPSHNR